MFLFGFWFVFFDVDVGYFGGESFEEKVGFELVAGESVGFCFGVDVSVATSGNGWSVSEVDVVVVFGVGVVESVGDFEVFSSSPLIVASSYGYFIFV